MAKDGYGLTMKQRIFVNEYIKTGNIFNSAVKAGYSKNYAKSNATKLLANNSVQTYMAAQMAKLDKKNIATQEEILERLTLIARGEVSDETLKLDALGGQSITELRVATKEQLKALELLGKRYAMWTEKIGLDKETLSAVQEISLADKLALIKKAKEG